MAGHPYRPPSEPRLLARRCPAGPTKSRIAQNVFKFADKDTMGQNRLKMINMLRIDAVSVA